jgi:hypothetical protein
MNKTSRLLMAAASCVVGVSMLVNHAAQASLVQHQWYFGWWDCQIDGRPSRMAWEVVKVPQKPCDGEFCPTAALVKVVGKFSDSGSPWVPLAEQSIKGDDFNLRYLGAEQNNWFLKRNPPTNPPSGLSASGYTTGRGNQYPLSCRWVGDKEPVSLPSPRPTPSPLPSPLPVDPEGDGLPPVCRKKPYLPQCN